ncbi:MAG TPA: hypothetical protein VG294_15580, partial [Solirubrobacteraceae bacterium]|nr:hypothetical protein [Solirubrobacteraceae bacterium]
NELLAGDVEAMKRRTRNYARRQLTWMRKLADVNVIDVTDRSPTEVAALGLAAQHPRRAPGPPLRRPHAPPPAPRRSQPGPAPPAAHPPTPPPS